MLLLQEQTNRYMYVLFRIAAAAAAAAAVAAGMEAANYFQAANCFHHLAFII
jgi:hypothetical protein